MISQEYEEIREALIALLCVGDKVNWLHYNEASFDYDQGPLSAYHSIKQYTVKEISETRHSIKIVSSGYTTSQFMDLAEVYNGELFFWHAPQNYCNHSREERIAALGRIVNDPKTRRK